MGINSKLDTTQTVCGFCGKEMSYSASPGAFTQHLKKMHYLEYTDQNYVVFEDKSDFEVQQENENIFEKDSGDINKQEFFY